MAIDTIGLIGIAIALAALTVMGGYILFRLWTKRGRSTQSNPHKKYLVDVEARAGKKTYRACPASQRQYGYSRAASATDPNPIRTNFGASRGFQNEPPRPGIAQRSNETQKTRKEGHSIRRTPPKQAANGHRTSKGEVDIWRLGTSVSFAPVEPAKLRPDHSRAGDIFLEPQHGKGYVELSWI